MNKPKEFSIYIYDNPTEPIMKTTFYNEGKKEVTIITHRYCLDINYDLSDELRNKIQESIKEVLING